MKAQKPDTIERTLRKRLAHVLGHLRCATSSSQTTICYTPVHEPDILPPSWKLRERSEQVQTRIETYSWAQAELRQHLRQPVSIFEALAEIENNVDSLVQKTIATLESCVTGLVTEQYRNAVMSRNRLISQWPWPLERAYGGAFVHLLLALYPSTALDEPLSAAWPLLHTMSATVAQWAEPWLVTNAHPGSSENLLARMKSTVRNTPMIFAVRWGLPFCRLTTPALALLFHCEHEVRKNQQRQFIAIDTSKTHTKFLEAFRDLPKSPRPAQGWAGLRGQRLELVLPDKEKKRHIQLSLNLGEEGLSEQMTRVIRQWRDWEGLRHWVTFQSLITGNKRLGWVRWTVDTHLQAQNLSKQRQRRPEVRQTAAELVKLFTQIEIGVVGDKGRILHQRPIILVGGTFKRLVVSQWEMEGLELRINPLLYRGIRDPDTGKIGTNWWPTTKELPFIDHKKYGPAIALGTILPTRWRMELANTQRSYVDLKGASLLRAAGLPYKQNNVTATWRSLERNLTELQKRQGVGRWEWHSQPDLSAICRLHPPTWALDRIAHGVPPNELEPVPTALTGAELTEWRTQEDLTQAQAATYLGVGRATIQRAEAAAEKTLSKKLRDALAAVCDSR